jgi:hypothetical protein
MNKIGEQSFYFFASHFSSSFFIASTLAGEAT